MIYELKVVFETKIKIKSDYIWEANPIHIKTLEIKLTL
jgi:hypothetical protein